VSVYAYTTAIESHKLLYLAALKLYNMCVCVCVCVCVCACVCVSVYAYTTAIKSHKLLYSASLNSNYRSAIVYLVAPNSNSYQPPKNRVILETPLPMDCSGVTTISRLLKTIGRFCRT